MTIRLRLAENHIHHLQVYETMATLLSQAFGGKKTPSGGTPPPANAKEPKTADEARLMFNKLFR